MPEKSEKRTRTEQVFEFIKKYQREHGRPPTDREIAQGVGLRSPSTADYHVKKLIAAGKMDKERHVARGLSLQEPWLALELVRIPILGRIAAGTPIFIPDTGPTAENGIGYVDIPRSNLPQTISMKDVFALEVSGESMRDANIHDGDIVILHKTANIKSGDIVAAWIVSESTTTLKRVRFTEKGLWLEPENPSDDFKETYYARDDVILQGRFLCIAHLSNLQPQ
jgi:repressor LexA